MELLYKVALYKSKNEEDALDLVQDTYLRAYRFFDKFAEGTNCRAWLLKILHNTFINKFYRDKIDSRKVYISDMRDMELYIKPAEDSGNNMFDESFDDHINFAMNSLMEKYRTVILMADIEGFSYREIADTVGCPIGTVMSRLHRARNILRRRLKDYAVEYGYIGQKSSMERKM